MMRVRTCATASIKRASACWLLALGLWLQPAALQARDPETLYMMECQGCHLSDGAGGLNNIPTLKNSVANFPTVAGGREFLVQVPGVALSALSDRDLTAVLNWMLRKFGPLESTKLYPPYTVDEVAMLRKQPLTEVVSKRDGLVAAMQASAAVVAP